MCGIICVLGSDRMIDHLLYGLIVLKNRGYDSCGVCYIQNHKFECIKHVTSNSVKLVEQSINKRIIDSNICIGHTRWATHGNVSEINAHPHFDNSRTISIVHNGIIENCVDLKKELERSNYFFRSQTDTEVIVVLVGYYIDQGFEMKEAIEKTIERLQGTWAIVFLHREYPNTCWITRNGSPLLIGTGTDFVLIASERSAFGTAVNRYIVLDDHGVLEISKNDDNEIVYSQNIHECKSNEHIHESIPLLSNTQFDHWFLKELHEQPESINRALNNGGRILDNESVKLGGLDCHHYKLITLQHLVMLGCGTSYHSALWSSHIFKDLDIFDTVTVYDGGDFNRKDIPKGRVGFVLISQSGETKDLHRCIRIIKEHKSTNITIGVVNVVDSMIARETDCGVYLNAGYEISVASTKSFSNQCVVLSLIAVWFSQHMNTCFDKRRQIISDVMKLSFQIDMLLKKTNETFLSEYIDNLEMEHSMFIVGKGKTHSIALEGALKLKELTYIHAEAFCSSSLKHGPLSLITQDTPIIILDIDNEYHSSNWNCYQEIVARGGDVIYVTNDPIQKVHSIFIERNTTYSGILCNVLIQLIAYYLARRKGNDIDCPRNLAKVVTVY